MTFTKSHPFGARLPGLSVMDRYLASELVLPFLFGVGAFSSVGLAIGSLFELVRKVAESGLPLGIAVKVLLLKIPHFIAYALPTSTLLATLMAYSRLSSDSEIIALRSVGVSVYRIVLPAIVLSLLISGTTFLFNELFVPAANYQASITLDRALDRENPSFKDKNIFHTEYGDIEQPDGEEREVMTRLFYAERFNGERMQGLTIIDRSQQGVNQIITAKSATWNLADNVWDFFNGTIYLIAPDGSFRNIVRFEHQKLKLPKAPLDLAQKGRDYDQMNIAQSLEYLKVVQGGSDERKLRELKIRIHQKISVPFVCVVFGLVGSALGTKPQHTGKATSFGISVMVIFFYYLLVAIMGAMGQMGIFSPFMAAWIPNFTGLGAGGWLLVRSAR